MTLFIALVTGLLVGAFYYGGLWFTIRAVVKSRRSWLLIVSFWGRTAIALAVLLLVTRGDWRNAIACLVGFGAARFVVTRYLRTEGA
jgi:F1F0 ATPase subunit 2